MDGIAKRYMLHLEQLFCVLLILWLQLVGIRTHSVLHHLLHAMPLALLLFVPASGARHFTGLLASYLWVFMLAAVSPMLHNALVRGYIWTHPEIPYTWLAPVAALLAAIWAASNAALLSLKPRSFVLGIFTGMALTGLFAFAHPYLSLAFEHPLEQTLAGEYAWGAVLLLETALVLALPGWCAFRLSADLRFSVSFAAWQALYWLFFVVAMVAGLLPVINR